MIAEKCGYVWEIKDQHGHIVEAVFFPFEIVVPMPADDDFPKGYYIVKEIKIGVDEMKRIGIDQ